MKLSLKSTLPVMICVLLSISGCANQLAAPPVAVNLPDTVSATPTLVADETAPPEPTSTSEPTPTPQVQICKTSMVRAIPEYNNSNLLTSFQTVDPFVVLTIDDGYSNTVFDQVLDLLEEHNVNATFFLVGTSFGEKIKKETLIRLIENGNDIAYHSYAHPEVSIIEAMTTKDWISDYKKWSDTLLSVIGSEAYKEGVVPYARAPYGAWTSAFMNSLDEQGLVPVHWNADEHTFEANRTPLRGGSILILHVIPENLDELEQLMATDWNVISLRQALGEVCN
jgi:peptidoglycan/xylan/chitin deacetylase (PgdA/CDA1 family)